jgi:hypothetical protein
MASIDEIVSRLQSATDQVNESIQALSGAESDAGEMQSHMASMGIEDKAAVLGGVREAIGKARDHLAGGAGLIEEAMSQAKAASGPTV